MVCILSVLWYTNDEQRQAKRDTDGTGFRCNILYAQVAMRLMDVARRVIIDPRKLTGYALDPDHPVGCHKAHMFQHVLGFTKDNYEALLEQITRKALSAEAILRRADAYGNHYVVDIEIIGPQGQQAVVRTGWFVATDSDEAWLTTLYIRKRE